MYHDIKGKKTLFFHISNLHGVLQLIPAFIGEEMVQPGQVTSLSQA